MKEEQFQLEKLYHIGDEPEEVPEDIAFIPGGKRLLSIESQGIYIREVDTGKKIKRLIREEDDPPESIYVDNYGKSFIVLYQSGALSHCVLPNGPFLAQMERPKFDLTRVLFKADGTPIVIQSQANFFQVIKFPEGKEIFSGEIRTDILDLQISPRGDYFVIAGGQAETDKKTKTQGEITVWNILEKQLRHRINSNLRPIHSLAFTPEGNSFIVNDEQTIYLFDAASGDVLNRNKGKFERNSPLAFASKSNVFAAVEPYETGSDNDEEWWNAEVIFRSISKLRKICGTQIHKHDDEKMTVIQFSPDGSKLLTVKRDHDNMSSEAIMWALTNT